MERPTVAQKSSPKRTLGNNKKKPGVKVVYISDPVRVRTSESEFRAVVQELTGQDSDIAENMEKYQTTESVGKPEADQVRDVQQAELYKDVDCPFEMPVLDNVPGYFMPTQFNDYQDGFLSSFLDG